MSIRDGINKVFDNCYSEELADCHHHTIFQRQKALNEIISYLKSQNWKSPEDCKKCLEGLDVAMKPPIKKRGFVVYEDDPMYEAILARRDLDSRKLQ